MPDWLIAIIDSKIFIAVVSAAAGAYFTYLFTRRRDKKIRAEKKEDERIESLKAEIQALRAENLDLKERLKLYEDVAPSTDGEYYILKETGERICPICWRAKSQAIPIFPAENGYYVCRACGKNGVLNRAVAERINQENERPHNYLIDA